MNLKYTDIWYKSCKHIKDNNNKMGCFYSICGPCDSCLNVQLKISIPNDTNIKEPTTQNFCSFFHTLNHQSYLFEFTTRQITQIESGCKVEFSNFALSGLKESYNFVKKKMSHNCKLKDCFVACPVYADPKTGQILDTQLAITGTCYKNEDYLPATLRELSEEIGIVLANPNKLRQIKSFSGPKRTEVSYIANISGARCFNSNVDRIISGTDDKTKKVQVVVYGTISDLLGLYENIHERPESDDLLTIRYVRFINLKEFF